MKLLGTDEIVKEGGPVRFTMHPVTTAIQTYYMESSLGGVSLSENVEIIQYALKNVITDIWIDGKTYNPIDLADRSDLTDATTRNIFLLIGRLVMEEVVLGAETEKKSELPQKLGSSADNAENVPAQKTGKSHKKVA